MSCAAKGVFDGIAAGFVALVSLAAAAAQEEGPPLADSAKLSAEYRFTCSKSSGSVVIVDDGRKLRFERATFNSRDVGFEKPLAYIEDVAAFVTYVYGQCDRASDDILLTIYVQTHLKYLESLAIFAELDESGVHDVETSCSPRTAEDIGAAKANPLCESLSGPAMWGK